MADPRINYDIAANVTGSADVAALADQLDKLGGKLDGDLKNSAQAASQALRELTSKQQAVDQFTALKTSASDAAAKLAELQGKAQALGRELASTATPTRAQQGELNKLRDAVRAAKEEVTQHNAALDKARGALSTYGIDTKNLASAQVSLNAELKKAQTSAQDLSSNIRNQASASKEAASATQQHAGLLGELKNAAAGYIGVDLVKSFFDTAAAQEANRKALDQLTGSARAGGEEMDYLRGVADRLGIKIDDASRAYVGLEASTKGTNLEGQNTRAIFEAVVGAMAKLGKGSAETERALVAVAQMASKGTVSMEELRGQLGESLPGAMQAAAQAMGVTVTELDKLVSSGTVTADVLLPKMAEQLNKTFGTAPPDTLNAALSHLQNVITNAYTAMSDTGGADTMRFVIDALAKSFGALAYNAIASKIAINGFGEGVGRSAAAIVQALSGSKGQWAMWREETEKAAIAAAEELDKVRRSLGLVSEEEKKSTERTKANAAESKSAAEQLADAFTGVGNSAQGAGEKGSKAGEEILKKFNVQTTQGVLDLANAFYFAGGKSDEMRAKVATAIQEMSGPQLAGMAAALKKSYEEGGIAAQDLSRINTDVLQASFTKLGMDAQAAMGGISQKTAEAIGGVDAMVTSLDSAGLKGPDAARAIGEAFSVALNRADTLAGADAIKARIEEMRDRLGDKITDGLLDQAAAKARDLKNALDDAVPGINSVEEALRKLGVTSDASLKQTAATAKQAYDILAQSGQASARELGDAFKKAAETAIAANNGVAPGWVEAQAAMRGYQVEVDKTGKATLTLVDSTNRHSDAQKRAAGAVDSHTSALERQNAEQERAIAAQEKANDLATRELQLQDAKRKSGTISNVDAVPSFETQQQADAWMEEWKRQYAQANPFSASSNGMLGSFQYDTTQAEWNAEVNAMKLRNAMKGSGNASTSTQTPLEAMRSGQGQTVVYQQSPNTTQAIDRTVNIHIGTSNPYGIPTNATGQAAIERMARDVVDALQSAKTQVIA